MNNDAQALNPVVTLRWWQAVLLAVSIVGGAVYMGEIAIGALQKNITGLRTDIISRFVETDKDGREIRGSLSQSVDRLTDQISKLRDDLQAQITNLGDKIVFSNDQLRKDLIGVVNFRYDAINKQLENLGAKLERLDKKISF